METGKIGVLLINLGTPDSVAVKDVRKYLKQFLLDARVIDLPRWNRELLVRGIIVPFRGPKSAHEYQRLWTPEGSPIKVFGYQLKDKLQEVLGHSYHVALGMRYQQPSIESAINELYQAKVKKIIVLPLFPQYASATVGSVIEEVMTQMKSRQNFPQLAVINQFYDRADFIEAWAQIGEKYQPENYERIVFSYHGIPQRQLFKADDFQHCQANGQCCQVLTPKNQFCYSAQCFHTTKLLIDKMKLNPDQCITTFQSRLGKAEWTQPYTESTIRQLALDGVKSLLIFSPAFVADCLETTVELGMEYKDLFLEHGGEKYEMVESLNVSSGWINTLNNLVREV